MQAVGDFSNISGDVRDEIRKRIDLLNVRFRSHRKTLQFVKMEGKHCESLVHVVVKFARDACPFIVLSLDQVGAQLSESLFRMPALRNVMLFGTDPLRDVMRYSADNRRRNAFRVKPIVIFPDSFLAGARQDSHQSKGFTLLLDSRKIRIKPVTKSRSQELSHGYAQEFLHLITQDTCRSWIDGEKPALQIVRAEQIFAVLIEVRMGIFMLSHRMLHRLRLLT